jgi:hypothetical protein
MRLAVAEFYLKLAGAKLCRQSFTSGGSYPHSPGHGAVGDPGAKRAIRW